MEPAIVFYVARADNGVIGRDGGLPWRLPADLRRFKALTMGKPMLMGRATFESLGGPLPGRRHLVLTRDAGWRADGAEPVPTLAAALAAAGPVAELAVIGGAQVFAALRARAARVELTEVHDMAIAGDTILPAFAAEEGWGETAREDHPAADGRPAYSFVTLVRRA